MSDRLTTLQRTLSVHFVLVAIVPILLFGIIATTLLHRQLQNEVSAGNQSVAEGIAAVAEQFLAEVERTLRVTAAAVATRVVTDPAEIDQLLAVVIEESRFFETIYLLDADRRVTHLGLDPGIASQREDYRRVDYSRHALFDDGQPLTGPAWSGTFVSLATGEPSVTIALPLGDGQILMGNVNLRRLSDLLASYATNRNDLHAIVDRSGTLVGHSDSSLALQRVNVSDHLSIGRALRGQVETTLERHGEATLLESTAIVPRTGWVTWVGADMGLAMAPVDYIRNLLGAGMLLGAFFAGGVAIFDARRLMRPLSALSLRAGQVGAGHYEFSFAPSGFAEIDQLAANFREMILAVRAREDSLVASEQRFRDLVNSIEGVVWEMDVATGGYLFVSQRANTLLGYPTELWLENPDFWASRVHPDDVEQVVVRGRHSLALAENQDIEYRVLDRHGRMVWVRDLINVIWEDEEPRRLLGVMVDITERKIVEAELAGYRARLEELVDERSRQLEKAQSELVQKERLAILGQLTATVSHEIRNPLGTVANALYVIRESLPGACVEPVARPLALAERNVRRCDEIISELLDFSRRRSLELQCIDLDAWLEALLSEMFWPEQLERSWRLASGAQVEVDPERLRRALVNVITNSLQAMDEKGKSGQRLEIATRRSGRRCEIEVRDNGPGIPPPIRERIFEPLFSTKSFGVGLGVPIIKNIMEDHGGGVSFESTVGEGTSVTLWLPLLEDAPPSSV
jgi:PAS domain S-box-containing protein